MSKARPRKPCYRVLTLAIGLAGCAPKGDALYARAERSLEQGEVRAAVIDLKNLLKEDPESARARVLLGRALVAGGDFNAAAIELQKAKDLGAPRSLTLVSECRLLAGTGEFEKVLAKCKPQAGDTQSTFQLQVAVGQALVGLKRDLEARAQFQAVLAAEPHNLAALLGLADATATLDGLAAARAIVDQAPDAARQDAWYWMVVGAISADIGELPESEKAYARADELVRQRGEASRRLEPLGALARVQLRQGKIKEAIATGDAMARIAPDDPLIKQLRSQIAIADGRLDDARTLLEQAVAAMPENLEARLLLGMVNLQQGNLGQAEMHFSILVAKEPDNDRARRLREETRARLVHQSATAKGLSPAAEFLAMNGSASLALPATASAGAGKGLVPNAEFAAASGFLSSGEMKGVAEALSKAPHAGAADLHREFLAIIDQLRMGERDKAFARAEALLQQSGGDPTVRNMVGGVYAAGGRRHEARAQFNEVRRLFPQDADTQINLARLDLADGKADDAEKTFRNVVENDPRNLLATLGVAIAASAQGNGKEAEKWLQKARAEHPDSVETLLVMAQLYLNAGDLGKARAAVDEGEKKAPDSAAVSNARGHVLLAAKDIPGALDSFHRANVQDPEALGYALNLARAHLLNRDLDAALGVLDAVLKSEPKFVPALALAGSATLQAGQLEKATGYVERLRQAAPAAPITHWLEGDLAMVQKRYGQALEHYRNASADGTNPLLVVAQYNAASRAGAPQPHKVLEDSLAKNPNDVSIMVVLADDQQRRGDLDSAIKLYEGALTALPDNVVILNNLAVCYQAKGDARALDTAARAHALAPAAPEIQDTYGWVLVQVGSLDKGLGLLREAVRRLPDSAEVRYHYAAALVKKGNSGEAVEMLKRALRRPLPPSVKADAQALLQQLSQSPDSGLER